MVNLLLSLPLIVICLLIDVKCYDLCAGLTLHVDMQIGSRGQGVMYLGHRHAGNTALEQPWCFCSRLAFYGVLFVMYLEQ